MKITLLGETKGQPPVWLAPGNQRNDQQCLYAELTQGRPLIIRHRGIRIKSMNNGCLRVRKSGDTLFLFGSGKSKVIQAMTIKLLHPDRLPAYGVIYFTWSRHPARL